MREGAYQGGLIGGVFPTVAGALWAGGRALAGVGDRFRRAPDQADHASEAGNAIDDLYKQAGGRTAAEAAADAGTNTAALRREAAALPPESAERAAQFNRLADVGEHSGRAPIAETGFPETFNRLAHTQARAGREAVGRFEGLENAGVENLGALGDDVAVNAVRAENPAGFKASGFTQADAGKEFAAAGNELRAQYPRSGAVADQPVFADRAQMQNWSEAAENSKETVETAIRRHFDGVGEKPPMFGPSPASVPPPKQLNAISEFIGEQAHRNYHGYMIDGKFKPGLKSVLEENFQKAAAARVKGLREHGNNGIKMSLTEDTAWILKPILAEGDFSQAPPTLKRLLDKYAAAYGVSNKAPKNPAGAVWGIDGKRIDSAATRPPAPEVVLSSDEWAAYHELLSGDYRVLGEKAAHLEKGKAADAISSAKGQAQRDMATAAGDDALSAYVRALGNYENVARSYMSQQSGGIGRAFAQLVDPDPKVLRGIVGADGAINPYNALKIMRTTIRLPPGDGAIAFNAEPVVDLYISSLARNAQTADGGVQINTILAASDAPRAMEAAIKTNLNAAKTTTAARRAKIDSNPNAPASGDLLPEAPEKARAALDKILSDPNKPRPRPANTESPLKASTAELGRIQSTPTGFRSGIGAGAGAVGFARDRFESDAIRAPNLAGGRRGRRARRASDGDSGRDSERRRARSSRARALRPFAIRPRALGDRRLCAGAARRIRRPI